jgi:hypothetical protein
MALLSHRIRSSSRAVRVGGPPADFGPRATAIKAAHVGSATTHQSRGAALRFTRPGTANLVTDSPARSPGSAGLQLTTEDSHKHHSPPQPQCSRPGHLGEALEEAQPRRQRRQRTLQPLGSLPGQGVALLLHLAGWALYPQALARSPPPSANPVFARDDSSMENPQPFPTAAAAPSPWAVTTPSREGQPAAAAPGLVFGGGGGPARTAAGGFAAAVAAASAPGFGRAALTGPPAHGHGVFFGGAPHTTQPAAATSGSWGSAAGGGGLFARAVAGSNGNTWPAAPRSLAGDPAESFATVRGTAAAPPVVSSPASAEDLAAFAADRFSVGGIPVVPPPPEVC